MLERQVMWCKVSKGQAEDSGERIHVVFAGSW